MLLSKFELEMRQMDVIETKPPICTEFEVAEIALAAAVLSWRSLFIHQKVSFLSHFSKVQ